MCVWVHSHCIYFVLKAPITRRVIGLCCAARSVDIVGERAQHELRQHNNIVANYTRASNPAQLTTPLCFVTKKKTDNYNLMMPHHTHTHTHVAAVQCATMTMMRHSVAQLCAVMTYNLSSLLCPTAVGGWGRGGGHRTKEMRLCVCIICEAHRVSTLRKLHADTLVRTPFKYICTVGMCKFSTRFALHFV